MKHLHTSYAAILIALASTLCAACSDDEGDDAAPTAPAITVVENNLLFEPVGSTGYVRVNAPQAITAQVDASWCHTSVDDATVYVTTDTNTSFEGRTALLTINAGDATLQLPIQQRGIAVGSIPITDYHAPMAGERKAFYIRHDLPVNVTTDDEWLHPVMEGDSLIVTIDQNPDIFLRRGTLEYECNGYSKELNIVQYELERIPGIYYLGGTMSGSSTGFYFKLVRRTDGYYMNLFRVENWADDYIPVDFIEERCELVFHSASTIHSTNSSSDVFYFYTPEGTVATTKKATMKATLFYNPLWGTHYAPLEDGGTWGGGELYGLIIRANRALLSTNLIQFTYPYVVWIGPEDILDQLPDQPTE